LTGFIIFAPPQMVAVCKDLCFLLLKIGCSVTLSGLVAHRKVRVHFFQPHLQNALIEKFVIGIKFG